MKYDSYNDNPNSVYHYRYQRAVNRQLVASLAIISYIFLVVEFGFEYAILFAFVLVPTIIVSFSVIILVIAAVVSDLSDWIKGY
jgi:hypothetical protein